VKILFHTNAPWTGSGYGQQAAQLAPRLAAAGHDVAISCMHGLNGQATTWQGITCLPSGYLSYSSDVLPHHARGFFAGGPGLVLILYDAWCYPPESVRGLATAVWSPVHSDPMSHGDKMFYGLTGAQPIAMSRYGEAKMAEFGLQPCYAPHGIDLSVFRPLDAAERAEARRILEVPQDAFLIAVIGANKGTNPPRKAWGEQFQAFARFRERHPDAVMYCHTIAASPHGLDLRPVVASLDLEGKVKFSGDYPQIAGLFTPSYVAGLMGCADVFSNPSYGEGFGLPALEAQACGIPVVLGDNSAQTEMCGAGWLAECQPYWVSEDSAWWHAPSIRSIEAAWEQAYAARGDRELRGKAREFAAGYDADLVFTQHWKPILEMLEQYAGAVPVRSQTRNHGAIPLPTAMSDGLRWIQRGGHTDDWIATGHEENLAPVLDSMLPEGGVFVDVGAHVGRWALRLAAKASRVKAVEANPDTAAVLRAHIELNDITNVDVLEYAAWDEMTSLSLDDPNRRVSGGSTRVVEGGGPVEAVPLDSLLGGVTPDLIKLDVEGADLRALRGLAGTLARCGPRLLIERHDIYGYYELADLTGLLEELGYRWRHVTITIQGGSTAPYIAAEPEDSDG
jgi:FkbM family methyltransferase